MRKTGAGRQKRESVLNGRIDDAREQNSGQRKPVTISEDKELTAEQASQVKGGALPRVGWEVNTSFSSEETSDRISPDSKK